MFQHFRGFTFKALLVILSIFFVFTSCDDSTNTLGVGMMPESNFLTKQYQTYGVKTRSYEVGDSVLARTSTCYLGRYSDPETGTVIQSDFLAQFHVLENSLIEDSLLINDSISNCYLRLFYGSYVGDSLASFKVSVYPLDSVMSPYENYYTNIDASSFYDETKEPIVSKWYTLSDRNVDESVRWSSKIYSPHISIKMPRDVGQKIYEAFLDDENIFKNSETWINSGLIGSKGFYFKLEKGDGAIAYITSCRLDLEFDVPTQKVDSVAGFSLVSTEEVVQANRFDNSNLETLLEDESATYLKSPAGIFTEATLPTSQINITDTINQASLTFTRYNSISQNEFKIAIPQTLLMVRLDDYLNGFFERYTLVDDKTSYLATFNSSTNSYEFSNISKLITTILREKKQGKASANADKVLLIPVVATYDSNKKLVRLTHDFSLTSARLVGGQDEIQLKVIYSTYHK